MQWVWLANLIQSRKPNCQHNLHQPANVTLPPPTVLAVSSAKRTTRRQQYSPSQYRQSGQPGSTSFIWSDVQQPHTYQQQQQQAYSGHAISPAAYSETQDEDEEEEVDEEVDETNGDEMKRITSMKNNLIPVIILKVNDKNIRDPWLALRAGLV